LDNGQVVKLVVATGGSLAAAGDLVQMDASEGNSYSVEPCAANGNAIGVALAVVATDSYGFIQVGGAAEVKNSNATLAAAAMVIPSASGITMAANATATNGLRIIGKALDANGTTAALSTVQLKGLY
jgi:hypothetical protein